MKIKKILSSLLAATMLFGSVTANAVTVESKDVPERSGVAVETVQSGEVIDSSQYGLCDNIEDGAILHAWCWSCATITANMEDIAEAGYTAVQTSPMQRSYSRYSDKDTLMGLDPVTGDEIDDGSAGAWWWQYQPTEQKLGNYQFFSDPGNYDSCCNEYKLMCDTAHAYGVKIITDVVTNHTTSHYKLNGDNEDTSLGLDISDDLKTAVGGYDKLFHTGTPKGVKGETLSNPDQLGIGFYDRKVFGGDYTRQHLINYMNGGLPDINTENHAYQAYVINYLNSLIKLGCDGFRFDTAHRIGVTEADGTNYNYGESTTTYDYWSAVTGQTEVNGVKLGKLDNDTVVDPGSLFIYGEMLKHDYDTAYTNYICITDDTYGKGVRDTVHKGTATKGGITKESSTINGYSVTWVESHDDYCNSHDSKDLSNDDINFSWAIMTARGIGTPLFFNRPAGSDAVSRDYWGNNKIGVMGNTQFKDPIVVAANKFRNAMANSGAYDEYLKNISNNNFLLQIDRYKNGDPTVLGGSCIINMSNADKYIDTATKMQDGTYIDSVSGGVFTVTGGKLKGLVPARSIAAVYTPTTANLTAISEVSTFDTETVTATLGIANAAEGKYHFVVDGTAGTEYSFNDGDTITVGSGVSYEKVITLVLSATDNAGNSINRSYQFKKTHNVNPLYVYFDNSGYGWSDVYAYIYTGSGNTSTSNSAWPGERMSIDKETGYYKYEVPYELRNGKIVFTEGSKATTNRYPADGSSGLQINNTTWVFRNNELNALSSAAAEAATVNNSYNNETTFDMQSKNYLYFFNSFAWTDVTISLSGGTAQSMKWSDELHCYYCEYSSSDTVSSITVNGTYDGTAGQSITTTDVHPGKMLVPTNVSGSKDDGFTWSFAWKDLSEIRVGKLYLDFESNAWSCVRASIYNASGAKDRAWPGAEMVKVGTDVSGLTGDLYSCTYYYVDNIVNNVNTTKPTSVKFNNRDTTPKHHTGDLNIPSDNAVCIISDGNPTTQDVTSEIKDINQAVTVDQDITIEYHYYDRAVGDPSTGTERSKEFSYTATTSDLSSVVTSGIGQLGLESVYDNNVYFGTQLKYVLGIASYYDDGSKRNNSLTYGGRINPKFLSNKTSSFGGRFGDNVGNLSVSGENWVTYKDSDGNVVSPDDVLPDLSNVSTVVVWGFAEPKTYAVTLKYPTTTATPTKTVVGTLVTDSYLGTKQHKCGFNQVINGDISDLTPGIQNPSNCVFDGWYQINFDGNGNVSSYLKVSEDLKYTARVTKNITLYAVYSPTKITTKTASVTANPIDKGLDDKGNRVYRYNTMLNIFNCEESDKKITDVGVMYVNLSSGENVNYTSVKTNVGSAIGNGTSSDNNYHYYQYSVKDGEATLTNKNRIQFTYTLSDSQISGNYANIAAFAVYRYEGNNDWIVSDNCVQYKYSGGSVTVTEINR